MVDRLNLYPGKSQNSPSTSPLSAMSAARGPTNENEAVGRALISPGEVCNEKMTTMENGGESGRGVNCEAGRRSVVVIRSRGQCRLAAN